VRKEPALLFLSVAFFENDSTERRCQGERHKTRNRYGDGNRDRELLIEFAGHAAQKRDRNKDGGKHEYDRHQGGSDFLHGFLCGLPRGKSFLRHEAFDVFEHYDRVIHHNADRERHREEREGV